MKLPCELLEEPYIVRVRKKTAKLLSKKGWTQTAIADTLQLSQPVISNYLKSPSSSPTHQLNLIVATADKVAQNIVEILVLQGSNGIPDAISRICESCKILRTSGPACSYHISIVPELQRADICTACLTSKNDLEYIETNRYEVIRALNRSLFELNKFNNIGVLIPEIGLQFVYGSSSISSLVDIAGFPGRLRKYKGKIISQILPEFGASSHTAQILLKAHKHNIHFRAAISLKHSSSLASVVATMNIKTITMQINEIHKISFKNASNLFSSYKCINIVESEGVGIEGISYFIGESVDQLVALTGDILSALQ